MQRSIHFYEFLHCLLWALESRDAQKWNEKEHWGGIILIHLILGRRPSYGVKVLRIFTGRSFGLHFSNSFLPFIKPYFHCFVAARFSKQKSRWEMVWSGKRLERGGGDTTDPISIALFWCFQRGQSIKKDRDSFASCVSAKRAKSVHLHNHWSEPRDPIPYFWSDTFRNYE